MTKIGIEKSLKQSKKAVTGKYELLTPVIKKKIAAWQNTIPIIAIALNTSK